MKPITLTSLDELDLIDLTIKKFTRPTLGVSYEVLAQRRDEILRFRHDMLQRLHVTATELRSNNEFARLLKEAGVKYPPTKVNAAGLTKYAFAKTDNDFLMLQTHPTERVRELVAARLEMQSSQELTRLETLICLTMPGTLALAMGRNQYALEHVRCARLSVPLLYYGAHTGRFSGTDRLNLQNLPRGGALREAIIAPPGYKLVAADLAQIEARMTATLAEQWDLVGKFASGVDVYADFASDIYGFPVNAQEHPTERFVGKTGILSLGFMVSAPRFHATMNYVHNTPLSMPKSFDVVRTYRIKYSKIPKLWKHIESCMHGLARGERIEWGPVTFANNQIILPNGMPINYFNLTVGFDGMQYESARGPVTIYGAKALENIVQALSRIVLTTAELRLAKHGLFAALSVHDELIYVVKEQHAGIISRVVKAALEEPVPWLPDLPLKAEVKIGDNYKECK